MIPPQPPFHHHLNPLNNHRPLTIQLIRIPFMTLLLTILQSTTPMILQHAMFPAKVSLAEGAVPDDALRGFLAVFECAAGFHIFVGGGCAAAEGEGDGYCGVGGEEGG